MAPSGKKFNFEALPTEWKPINKNCIILQLNGTAIKIAVLMGFNGDIFVQKVLSVTIILAWVHRVKFGLILKKTHGRLSLK